MLAKRLVNLKVSPFATSRVVLYAERGVLKYDSADHKFQSYTAFSASASWPVSTDPP